MLLASVEAAEPMMTFGEQPTTAVWLPSVAKTGKTHTKKVANVLFVVSQVFYFSFYVFIFVCFCVFLLFKTSGF